MPGMTWNGKFHPISAFVPVFDFTSFRLVLQAYWRSWLAETHQKLLLLIIGLNKIQVDFEAVASAFGPDCTPRAVQEQLKKLKKKAKENGDLPTSPVVIKTPAKSEKGNTKTVSRFQMLKLIST